METSPILDRPEQSSGNTQHYWVSLEKPQKKEQLTDLLDAINFERVLIFVNTREQMESLLPFLLEKGFPAACVDSKHPVFNEKARVILVCETPLHCDIPDVNMIINYDAPYFNTVSEFHYEQRREKLSHPTKEYLVITFLSSAREREMMEGIRAFSDFPIYELPEQILFGRDRADARS
jgi:superfamily II DNA/RNA helicase